MHRPVHLLDLLVLALLLVQCGPGPATQTTATTSSAIATAPSVGTRPTVPPRVVNSAPLGTVANPIKLASSPSVDASRYAAGVDNIAHRLDQISGLKFQVSVPMNYPAVIEAMQVEQVDVAFLTPTLYVTARKQFGAELLLTATRNGSRVYPFALFVRADSNIHTIEDLRGKRLGSADPLSTSGNIFPRAYLISQGIIPDKDISWVYTGGHDRSMLALLKGDIDVAAAHDADAGRKDARDLIKATNPDVFQQIRIIFHSGDKGIFIPNTTVSVRPGLPEDVKTKIRDGLLQLVKTDDGKRAMTDILSISGLTTGDPKDYDVIEQVAQTAGVNLADELAPSALSPLSPPPTTAPAPTSSSSLSSEATRVAPGPDVRPGAPNGLSPLSTTRTPGARVGGGTPTAPTALPTASSGLPSGSTGTGPQATVPVAPPTVAVAPASATSVGEATPVSPTGASGAALATATTPQATGTSGPAPVATSGAARSTVTPSGSP